MQEPAGALTCPLAPRQVTGVRTLSGSDRAPPGYAGLDDILGGGFVLARIHLVEGKAGTGKTTLGMQFVLAGRERGEKVLFITMSETRDELQAVAVTHGWSLEGIEISELVPPDAAEGDENRQTMFRPSEVELGETMRLLCGEIERIDPVRIVLELAFRDAAAGAEPAALSATDFRVEALPGAAACDGADDRRRDVGKPRFAASQHRPRRGHLGGIGARLRRGAAAVAGDENARG